MSFNRARADFSETGFSCARAQKFKVRGSGSGTKKERPLKRRFVSSSKSR